MGVYHLLVGLLFFVVQLCGHVNAVLCAVMCTHMCTFWISLLDMCSLMSMDIQT